MFQGSFEDAGVSLAIKKKIAKPLRPYIDALREASRSSVFSLPLHSLCLPFDQRTEKDIQRVLRQCVTKKLKYLFVIGIGGSSLGSKAVYEAWRHGVEELFPHHFPKVIFLDTMDSDALTAVTALIQEEIHLPEECLMNVISKSGSTLEVLVNMEIVLEAFRKKFGLAKTLWRLVVTSSESSPLFAWARQKGVCTLSSPEPVGDRFALFSPVGLFPLAVAGYPWQELRKGAREALRICLTPSLAQNPALQSAAILFHYMKKGKGIFEHFFFSPSLESVGKWCRQLVAESLGKRKEIGLTPTVALGSVDLHSIVQLNLAGPFDKITAFISVQKRDQKIPLPQSSFFHIAPTPYRFTVSEAMDAILRGTKTAYKKYGRPFFSLVLPKQDAFSLGVFFQYKMIETLLLAALMKVNPFDQPLVESYKKEMWKILK